MHINLFTLQELQKHTTIRGYSFSSYLVKKVIDIVIGLFLLAITFPVSLYTIFRIKKESPGKIIFKQTRIGINGKKFICYKFRSMDETTKDFNHYTQDDDNRVFSYGKIMRKYRIDELPQLFNILKGDMHLVGPRAEWNELVEKYEKVIPFYHQRHLVKPGITGLAQVSYPYGRNIDDTKEKLKYDLKYLKEWSFLTEIDILLKTVMVIIHKKGI